MSERQQKPDCYDYVRNYYNVPAYIGVKVSAEGKTGVIVAAKSDLHYVRVLFDDRKFAVPVHPRDLTYQVAGSGQ